MVLNYCSLEDTLACVACVRRIGYPNLRLLVIDNASPDGSGPELARRLPSGEFLQNGGNEGYAGGNNRGIAIALNAGVDYVLIVNPDVRLDEGCVAHYVEVMQRDPSIGALNPIQLAADRVAMDYNFRHGVLIPAGYVGATLAENAWRRDVIEVSALFGAALMISAEALRRVGGFDPLYFAYGEEIDLCRRMRYHGYRLVVTTGHPVVHLRTNYARGLSDYVLFLKLKGYFLCQLKDPVASFRTTMLRIASVLWRSFWNRAPDAYPFNAYPIARRHVARAMAWFVRNALAAWWHRRSEMKGRAHV